MNILLKFTRKYWRHFAVAALCILLCAALVMCGGQGTGTSGVSSDPEAEERTMSSSPGTEEKPDGQISGESADLGTGSDFPFAFEAQNLYGETVTEADLGEKEVFFVHYWGTWCGPCVAEMPELAELADEYGDRVGFIALLDDYEGNIEGAVNITESAGIPSSFVMVDAKTPELSGLFAMLQTGYVPTTVLLNGGGELLTDPIIGAAGKVYAETLDGLLA